MITRNVWCAVCAIVCAFVAIVSTSALAAPVHVWTFDTDFNDSVGTAHGTAIGSGVSITSAAGEFLVGAGGLKIAHTNNFDFVDIAVPVFPAPNPMTFSVNLFYRFDPTIGNDDSRNFLFETSPGFSVGIGQGAANDMEWFFEGPPATISDDTGPITNDNNWHQATLVWDKAGSGNILFYHDGVLRDQRAIAVAADFNQASQAQGLHIGAHRDVTTPANGRNWVGYIDEFAIENSAISPGNVFELYENTFGVLPPSAQALELSAPAGASVAYNFIGAWERATYNDVLGGGNDLGDGGFSGGDYARTVGIGDHTLEITLTDLPEHDFVNLGMILAQLDSIDPVRDGDRFILLLDGVEIFNEGFGYGESTDPPPPDNTDPVYADPEGIATLTNSPLFGDVLFNENMYDLGAYSGLQNISHTSSTLTLSIIGRHNQAAGEFYGIDRVAIEVGVVPEPSSLLMIAGLALGLILYQRKCG